MEGKTHCINTESPEFKKLYDQSELKAPVLAAKIAIWQENNGTKDLPSDSSVVEPVEGITIDHEGRSSLDKKVSKRVAEISRGKYLTNEEIIETKRAETNFILDQLNRNEKGSVRKFETNFNDEGVITSIVIRKENTRGGKDINAKRTAEDRAKRINRMVLASDDNFPVAIAEFMGRNYKVKIRLRKGLTIARHYFPLKRNEMFRRRSIKMYKRKAALDMLLNNEMSTKDYKEYYSKHNLSDISLNKEEQESIIENNKEILSSGVEINGEWITDPEEYILREDEDDGTEDNFDFDETAEEASESPIRLENFKEKRKAQSEKIQKMLYSLRNEEKINRDSKKYRAQIDNLIKIKESVDKDLQLFNTSDEPHIDLIRKSFMRDIKRVNSILENPSDRNLFIARDMIDFMGKHLEQRTRDFKGSVIAEEFNNENLDELIEDLSKEQIKLKDKHNTIAKKKFIEVIDTYAPNLIGKNVSEDQKKQEIKDLFFSLSDDTDFFSDLVRALGEDYSVDDTMGRLIRRVFDVEVGRNTSESSNIINRINSLMKKAKKRVEDLGTTSMDLFTTKSDNGDLQMVSKFSQEWRKFIYNNTIGINKRIKELRTEDKEENKNKKINRLYDTRYKNLTENSEIVDPRYLPGIYDRLESGYLRQYFEGNNISEKEKEDYKEKVISRIGESEYDNLIDKQVKALEDYESELNRFRDDFLQENESIYKENLSDRNKAIMEAKELAINPFFILDSKTENNVEFELDGRTAIVKAHLDHNRTIPKEDKEEFFDKNFKTIENDEILFETWQELTNAIRTINENFSGSELRMDTVRSLFTFEKDSAGFWYSLKNGLPALGSYISTQWTNVKEAIHDEITTKREVYDKDKIKIRGSVRSFKQRVRREHKANSSAVRNLLNMKVTEDLFNIKRLDSLRKESVADIFGLENGDELEKVIKDTITNSNMVSLRKLIKLTQAKVYREQNKDIFKHMKALLEMSSEHKARKDTKNLIENVFNVVSDYSKTPSLKSKLDFFERSVINNFRNSSGELKKDVDGSEKVPVTSKTFTDKFYRAEEKRLRRIYKEEIKRTKMAIDQGAYTGNDLKKAKREVNRMEALLKTMGNHLTVGSFLEAFNMNVNIKASLAINFFTSILNKSQGKQQAYIQSGYRNEDGEVVNDYTLQQIEDSYAFLNSVKHNNFITNKFKRKGHKEEIDKLHLFMQKLHVIQDGTDFMQRAERVDMNAKPTINPFRKDARKLLILHEFVEYYNQTAVALATMSNYTFPNGDPVFEKDRFKHYEIKDGNFVLKNSTRQMLKKDYGLSDEYITSHYQDFNSDEALSFRAYIASDVIPRRNGDYSLSGAMKAKKGSFGKLLMTFSTWTAGIAGSAFDSTRTSLQTGKKEGGYLYDTAISEEGKKLLVPLGLQNILTNRLVSPALILSSIFPVIQVMVGIGAMSSLVSSIKVFKARRRGKKNKDINKNEISLETKDVAKFVVNNIITAPVKYGIRKVLSFPSFLTGKRVDAAVDNFDYSFGGKLDNRTAKALASASRQQAMLTFFAMFQTLVYSILSAIDFDEEEKESKGAFNLANKQDQIEDEKGFGEDEVRNIIANMLDREYQDASITTNPESLLRAVFKSEEQSNIFSINKSIGRVFEMSLRGEEYYLGNDEIYEGDKKSIVAFRKALPKFIGNVDKEGYMFGLEQYGQRTYSKSPLYEEILYSDYKKDKQDIRKERNKLRNEIRNEKDYYDASAIEQKIIDKIINFELKMKKRYPFRFEYDEDQERKGENIFMSHKGIKDAYKDIKNTIRGSKGLEDSEKVHYFNELNKAAEQYEKKSK